MAAPVTEAAIRTIRALIVDGTLPSGSRLPAEQVLAAQLGLSRNALREAVSALVTARVLDVRRGDGTYVTSLEPQLLLEGIGFAVELMQEDRALELLEMRRVIEPAVSAMAARRRTAQELTEIRTSLEEMEHTRGEKRITQDIHFHALIAAAAHNQTLATVLAGVSGQTVHARIWHGALDSGADARAHADHQAIFAAIADGDAIVAESAARVHVVNTERWYRAMIASEQGAAGDAGPGKAP